MKYWGISIEGWYTIVSAITAWTAVRKGAKVLKDCYDNKKAFVIRVEPATKDMKADFDRRQIDDR